MEHQETIIIALIVILVALSGFGMMGFGGDSRYGMMSGYGWGYMSIFGGLMMILVLIALSLFIIWFIKQLTGHERKRKR